ncbi:MAG: magnesium/cobalt transporter CorA [Dehalococcoidia bacterium]|nr:magnesium/cobalt transporter CorA [Dehalococcoidia bacterium]
MPHSSIYRTADGSLRRDLADDALVAVLAEPDGLLWVHTTASDADDGELLRTVFGVHPLAVADIVNTEFQAPKVDDYERYLFLKLHGVDHEATGDLVVTTELDIVMGPNWVVTASHQQLAAIEQLWASTVESPRVLERGSSMLVQVLIDALVDSVLPTIQRMDDVGGEIEERALVEARSDLLGDILRLKRSAMRLHRVVVPQRDIVQRLSRGEYSLISGDTLIYYRDIYDHLVRVEYLVLNARERADSALTTYLSAVNIRQNETMRVLAIVTSAFLPLTLLTGIYGMNFKDMPELSWPWAYPVVIAIMVVVTVGVTWWLFGARLLARSRSVARVTYRIEQRLVHDAIIEAARLRDRVLLDDDAPR